MSERTHKILQAVILFGLSAFLFYKIVSGTLYFYINARFTWLVVLGGAVFLGLAFFAWPRKSASHAHEHEDHDHGHAHSRSVWPLTILSIPLALGFLVPSRPLDSSALDTRGLTTNALMSVGGQTAVQLDQPSDQRNVLDWVRAFNFAADPVIYEGEPADVIGFVYQDPRLPEGQFLVGRFAVSCCAADAFAIGMIVQSDEAHQWAANQWVHVNGTIQVSHLDGVAVPLIVAESIKEVSIPPQPYLFP
ncbi:MAG: TIGR03943 family protein [Anaerolineales bacterium]|nr:MAG: TIGR03943 family protein [Anaerolineales bacterium]